MPFAIDMMQTMIVGLMIVIPICMIYFKAGFNPVWAALVFLPYLGLVLVFVHLGLVLVFAHLALFPWPRLQQSKGK
jgi:hypothetical protein